MDEYKKWLGEVMDILSRGDKSWTPEKDFPLVDFRELFKAGKSASQAASIASCINRFAKDNQKR